VRVRQAARTSKGLSAAVITGIPWGLRWRVQIGCAGGPRLRARFRSRFGFPHPRATPRCAGVGARPPARLRIRRFGRRRRTRRRKPKCPKGSWAQIPGPLGPGGNVGTRRTVMLRTCSNLIRAIRFLGPAVILLCGLCVVWLMSESASSAVSAEAPARQQSIRRVRRQEPLLCTGSTAIPLPPDTQRYQARRFEVAAIPASCGGIPQIP